jgi:hypothetical protein
MEWEHLVIEFSANEDPQAELADLDSHWEAVAAWTAPGDPHINQGAWKVCILFKKPKS